MVSLYVCKIINQNAVTQQSTDRRWYAHRETHVTNIHAQCQCLTNRKTHVKCTINRCEKKTSRIYRTNRSEWKIKETWTSTTHDGRDWIFNEHGYDIPKSQTIRCFIHFDIFHIPTWQLRNSIVCRVLNTTHSDTEQIESRRIELISLVHWNHKIKLNILVTDFNVGQQ